MYLTKTLATHRTTPRHAHAQQALHRRISQLLKLLLNLHARALQELTHCKTPGNVNLVVIGAALPLIKHERDAHRQLHFLLLLCLPFLRQPLPLNVREFFARFIREKRRVWWAALMIFVLWVVGWGLGVGGWWLVVGDWGFGYVPAFGFFIIFGRLKPAAAPPPALPAAEPPSPPPCTRSCCVLLPPPYPPLILILKRADTGLRETNEGITNGKLSQKWQDYARLYARH